MYEKAKDGAASLVESHRQVIEQAVETQDPDELQRYCGHQSYNENTIFAALKKIHCPKIMLLGI